MEDLISFMFDDEFSVQVCTCLTWLAPPLCPDMDLIETESQAHYGPILLIFLKYMTTLTQLLEHPTYVSLRK